MRRLFSIQIPENRNFGLDLLRFVAILTVLISHSIAVLPPESYFIHKFIFDGVLIFFVLSGFLIGRILIRDFQQKVNLRKLVHFWQRRWFRTLPAYYFTIFIIIILCLVLGIQFDIIEAAKSLVFIQNIYYRSDSFFPESWSLSIEEWFYLTIPFIIFILNKVLGISIKKNIIVTFFVILLFSLFTRSYVYCNTTLDSIGAWDRHLRSPVITRLDSLLMGVLGAWYYIFKKDFFKANKNLLFTIGFVIFFSNKIYRDYINSDYSTFYASVIYFSLIPFSVALMLPKLYYLNKSKYVFFNNIITKGSLISYSMYLINLTIISSIVLQPLQINMWIKFALFWILTISFATLMYKYVETPFMKLRDKV